MGHRGRQAVQKREKEIISAARDIKSAKYEKSLSAKLTKTCYAGKGYVNELLPSLRLHHEYDIINPTISSSTEEADKEAVKMLSLRDRAWNEGFWKVRKGAKLGVLSLLLMSFSSS